jgi:hypothetical protein
LIPSRAGWPSIVIFDKCSDVAVVTVLPVKWMKPVNGVAMATDELLSGFPLPLSFNSKPPDKARLMSARTWQVTLPFPLKAEEVRLPHAPTSMRMPLVEETVSEPPVTVRVLAAGWRLPPLVTAFPPEISRS